MSDELPLEETPRWTVAPRYKRRTKEQRERNVAPVIKHWELQWNGLCQEKATGEREIDHLREVARFCNSRKLTPRNRVECIADLSAHPIKPLSKSERSDIAPPPAFEPVTV